MTPAFSSLSAFFAMGGYAFYVWLAVICTLISLGALLLHTLLQRRRLLAEIRQRQSRERRIRSAKMKQAAGEAAGDPM
ncbi:MULTISPECIES: heme exporter protein CcmD [Pantoea]|jgi:heme exporter protein D|uniref:Heme exporter protein D n=3 Tax=Pantoea piersonii TaxID=2364647 RepID=A0AAJ5QKM0_9GAMM|nr:MULTISPECIES: heme exporter protein CcmD [Pantoea]HCW99511.1 heme exporter protein CcmD [Pantoea sp.]MBZ6387408.1 heme exporter protein CcmD [Pantoea piersonii]MBZ6400719.1 heme exporter protein CcmD [Pantoea piersonii]MBZ6408669.1 heme exporter protein CcmD [Pantoea piersonii]MBZ6429222.1 heme exporter protein CcmD [Pantoea piersonii]